MGFIKSDPNQSKAVIPLIVILLGAVVVTIMRINPEASTQSVASSASVKPDSTLASGITSTAISSSRNPFKKPEFVTAAIKSLKSASGELSADDLLKGFGKKQQSSAQIMNNHNFGSESSYAHVAPMPVPSVAKTVTKEPEKPEKTFTLLATVKDSKGFSAVVKFGRSDEQVVEVGDILEGGFKVKQIEADRAVLTDGRDIVIAKRPNS